VLRKQLELLEEILYGESFVKYFEYRRKKMAEKKKEETTKEETVKVEETVKIEEHPKEATREEQLLSKVNESMRGRLESEIDRDDDYWKHLEAYRQYLNSLKG